MENKFFEKEDKIRLEYKKKSYKKIHFISFGSDERYLKLSKKVLTSLVNLYPSSSYKNYQSKDLEIHILNYCNKYKKGFGYWLWKPYLILKALRDLPLGSTLMYVDGRTGLHKECKKIVWFDKFINSRTYDVALYKTIHKEYKWTSGDLFSLFHLSPYSSDSLSTQYSATFLCLKNNYKSQRFIEAWLKIILNKSNLCRDNLSNKSNHENFIQNRHDQSVLSLLTKNSKKSIDLKVFDIPHPLKLEKPSLIPHYYYRPTSSLDLLKRYIKLFLIFLGILDKKYTGKYYDGLKV